MLRPSVRLLLPIVALLAPSVVAAASTAPAGQAVCAMRPGEAVNADDIRRALSKAGPPIDCRGQTIHGDLNLVALTAIQTQSGTQERIIARDLDFRGAVFKGALRAWDQSVQPLKQPRVRFTGDAIFSGAHFQGDVSLDGAIFASVARFGDARFDRIASFEDAEFEERVSFRSARFDERTIFRRAHFRSEADFAIATFNWIAFFDDSTFHEPSWEGANFLFTRFHGDTFFVRTLFKGIARFTGTRFRGTAYFSDATFEDQAWFAGGARFDEAATFRRARFTRAGLVPESGKMRAPVLFEEVVFSGDANFSEARFRDVNFGQRQLSGVERGIQTVFRSRADFRGAKFASLGLAGAIFQSEVRFSRADLGEHVDISDLDIAKASVHMTWAQLLKGGQPKFRWDGVFEAGKLQPGADDKAGGFFEFLGALERNFRERGQLADAGEAHYLAEDLKRSQEALPIRILDVIFVKGVYGYGVRPGNPVSIACVLIAVFALAYTGAGTLRHQKASTRSFWLRLTDIPVDWSSSDGGTVRVVVPTPSRVRRYWQGLGFSFYVFTKIGFGGDLAARPYAWIVITEWVLGLIVWIVFLANLSNRWPLLHRLVTAF